MPSVGEYGLEIYANNPETDGQSLRHAYQFLIICNKLVADPPAPYPALPANYLGPQPGFHSLGLVSDIEDPYLVNDTGELAVSFTTSKRVRLTAQLISVAEAASEDCSQYILQQALSEQLVKFIVRLPKLGTYKLQAGLLLHYICMSHVLYRIIYSSGLLTICLPMQVARSYSINLIHYLARWPMWALGL